MVVEAAVTFFVWFCLSEINRKGVKSKSGRALERERERERERRGGKESEKKREKRLLQPFLAVKARLVCAEIYIPFPFTVAVIWQMEYILVSSTVISTLLKHS